MKNVSLLQNHSSRTYNYDYDYDYDLIMGSHELGINANGKSRHSNWKGSQLTFLPSKIWQFMVDKNTP